MTCLLLKRPSTRPVPLDTSKEAALAFIAGPPSPSTHAVSYYAIRSLSPAQPLRNAAVRFLSDDAGSELVEYALALAFFAIVAIVGMNVIPKAAVSQVTTDDTNFSQSLANGY